MQICLTIFLCSQFISLLDKLTQDCNSKPILKQSRLYDVRLGFKAEKQVPLRLNESEI